MNGAVVIPVGPGATELDRLDDTLQSIRSWVPDEAIIVIDDDSTPRALAHIAPGTEVLRLPGPRAEHPHDNMTAGSIAALRWLADSGADYILKLDTDALVIGDYRRSLHGALLRSPDVGVWGAHRENEIGGPARDFSSYKWALRRSLQPVRVARQGRFGLRVGQAVTGHPGAARRFLADAVRTARRNGYELGEHCLGGAYAVTAQCARRMRAAGYLDDPRVLSGMRISEDVIVSLLAVASGCKLASLVGPGEAFAVRHHGLLAPPLELAARGHSIVHSLKDDGRFSESEIRTFFAERRARLG